MKRTLMTLALLIGLSVPRAAHAYGNNQDVAVVFEFNYDTGWWDDVIFRKDTSNTAQLRCPKMAFFPSFGAQVNTWATEYHWAPGPGQPPVNGTYVLTYCRYEVHFSAPAYVAYVIEAYPVCDGTLANISWSSKWAGIHATAGNSFSATQWFWFRKDGAFRQKTSWRQVLVECGRSTSVFDQYNTITTTTGQWAYWQ